MPEALVPTRDTLVGLGEGWRLGRACRSQDMMQKERCGNLRVLFTALLTDIPQSHGLSSQPCSLGSLCNWLFSFALRCLYFSVFQPWIKMSWTRPLVYREFYWLTHKLKTGFTDELSSSALVSNGTHQGVSSLLSTQQIEYLTFILKNQFYNQMKQDWIWLHVIKFK